MLPFARDAIARAAADPAWCDRLRASSEAASLFVELVSTVPDTRTRRGSMAGELHDVGLLLAMVPEFLPVTGRVHHDVYHVYTVDVHSVAAVDRLARACAAASSHTSSRWPRASRPRSPARGRSSWRPFFTTWARVGPTRPAPAKTTRRRGAELCDPILPRLGLAAGGRRRGAPTRLDHLLMYHVATRRDLDDPATIEEFSSRLPRARGPPKPLPSHGGRSLDDLAHGDDFVEGADARRALLRRRRAPRRRSRPPADADGSRACRRAVLETGAASARPATEGFLASMPERYFLANAPAAIVAHARVVGERGERVAHVARVPCAAIRRPPSSASSPKTDPGLLAGIAAAITANRLEVLAAQVYSRQAGAGARRSTSSGSAIATEGRRASRARWRGSRATSTTCARRASMPASSWRRASAPPRRGASGRAPRSRPRFSSTGVPRRATRWSRSSRETAPVCCTASPAPSTSSASRSRSRRSTPRGRAWPTCST